MTENRLIELFLEITSIDGISGKESSVNQYIIDAVSKYNVQYSLDDSGRQYNWNTGNLLLNINKTKDTDKKILLIAHTDTVPTGGNIEPVIKDNKIISSGDTILGADNRAAVAFFIRLIEEIYENNLKVPELYILFTFGEEAGLCGAKVFDFSKADADAALLFDHSGNFGEVVVSSPYHKRIFVEYIGKRAHAGVEPEKGINAISIASEVISKFKFGRIDDNTVWNVGKIEGGVATNIVPDSVKVFYEARSIIESRADELINKIHTVSEEVCSKYNSRFNEKIINEYNGYNIASDNLWLKIAEESMKNIGAKIFPAQTCGGSDANILFQNGIECLNFSFGAYNAHSYNEYLDIYEYLKTYKFLKNFLTAI